MLHLHSRTAELVDRGHTDQPVAPVSRDRLLEHLVSEVQACAVGIAMIATAANAMNDWQASIAPPDMARFAPDSAALRSLLKVLDAHHIDTEPPDAAFRAFADEVDTARIALDSFLNDCEALSPDRAKLLHARRLQDVWRHLARKSRSFILESERLFPKSIPYLYTQNTSVLSALLAGTASGLKPCLDYAGRLSVPPLPQRRRAPRRAVLQNCTVHTPSFTQNGFVRDASAGGLGLARVYGLNRGDRIRVCFASGRQFMGTVAWIKGSAAGMRFDVPLAADDGLIAI